MSLLVRLIRRQGPSIPADLLQMTARHKGNRRLDNMVESFLSSLNLTGKVVVLVGGAGGLGRELALFFEKMECNVVVVDLLTQEAFDKLAPESLGRVSYVSCDITCLSDVEACLTKIQKLHSTPDAVLNLAALDAPPDASSDSNGPFEDADPDLFNAYLDVNVMGGFLVARVFGAAMALEGKGSLIFFNSIYGVVSPRQDIYAYRREQGEAFFKPAAYSVTKSALTNFTRYLATYWGMSGLRVNQVVLGGVFNGQDDEFVKAYEANVPMGRMARVEDLLGPLALLVSDSSSYMTGSSITIDGGYTAW